LYKILFLIIGIYFSLNSESLNRIHPSDSVIKPSSEKFYNEILPTLRGKKIMLVTNPSGIGISPKKIKTMFRKQNVKLHNLLGLEHGFLGIEEDFSKESISKDKYFNIPIYHVYKLKKGDLESIVNEVDAIVFDVQDLSMRCYTYVSVLKRLMDVLQTSDRKLIILDHPNPGLEMGVRGDELEDGFRNFAGEFPSPLFSGMTMAESAHFYNAEYLSNKVNLLTIQAEGYKRNSLFERLGIPWNTPSPNLPNLDSTRNYFSLVLLEGINVSVGRGTPAPFVYFGAPWINSIENFENEMNEFSDKKIHFSTVYFKPAFNKFENKICYGLRMNLIDSSYDPIRLSYRIISYLRKNYPNNFSWAKWGEKFTIDQLWGNDSFRKAIEDEVSYDQFYLSFKKKEDAFREKSKKYLMY
jgi:uncharacterized protein YbbC (DUF1343 family)